MIGSAIKIVWPGGEHSFCFDIGHLRALEQRLDAGVTVVLLRLINGQFKVDDVIETLRLGLQGGGMEEKVATKIIFDAFPTANLYELSHTAARMLAMFISWPTGKDADVAEEPNPGEAEAATSENLSPTGESAGQDSSAPLQ